MTSTDKRACECEHAAHWNPGAHKYFTDRRDVKPVATPFGTFALCADCRREKHVEIEEPTLSPEADQLIRDARLAAGAEFIDDSEERSIDAEADRNAPRLKRARNPYECVAFEYWDAIRGAIAEARELDERDVTFVRAERFTTVYSKTPEDVGEVTIDYAIEPSAGYKYGRTGRAIYGVTADARVSCYAD